MATWNGDEIDVVRAILAEKRGPITIEDHRVIQQRLPERSLAAIKKKCLELKNNPAPKQQTTKWTKDEMERLIKEYSETKEQQIGSRIRSIIHLFPGRTEKAIATKLRETCPEIYYRKTTTIPEEAPNVSTGTTEQQNSTAGELDQENTMGQIQVSLRKINKEDQGENIVEIREEEEEVNAELVAIYERILGKVGEDRRKIRKFYLRKGNNKTVSQVNKILEKRIHQILHGNSDVNTKRKQCKKAIYCAGILLRNTLINSEHEKPQFERTEAKIKKLQDHNIRARKIQKWKGGKFGEELKSEARQMRKLGMKPKQYIKINEDRIKLLEKQLENQKKRHKVQNLRSKYKESPSIRTIQEKENTGPKDLVKVEKFFSKLYKKEEEMETTPCLNELLSRYRKTTAGKQYKEQLNEENIRIEVEESLKTSSPWKAPGEDRIPNYIYKILDTAKEYLKSFVTDTLLGRYQLEEKDSRAEVVLVHKRATKIILPTTDQLPCSTQIIRS